jgi:hypothetical protein
VYSDIEAALYSFDCDAGQESLKTFKAPDRNLTAIYNFKHQDNYYIAAVASYEKHDRIVLYRLNGEELITVKNFDTKAKVQRLALGGSLHHSGYSVGTCAHENEQYTATVHQINHGLMAFDDDELASADRPCLIVQHTDRSLYRLAIDLAGTDEIEPSEMFDLAHQVIKLQSAFVSGKEVVVGLTANMRLYINNVLFSNECTAFTLTQNFLTFLTSSSGLSHLLYIYDLNRNLPASPGPDQPPKLVSLEDTGNFNVRAVERGSRIVTYAGYKAVL